MFKKKLGTAEGTVATGLNFSLFSVFGYCDLEDQLIDSKQLQVLAYYSLLKFLSLSRYYQAETSTRGSRVGTSFLRLLVILWRQLLDNEFVAVS